MGVPPVRKRWARLVGMCLGQSSLGSLTISCNTIKGFMKNEEVNQECCLDTATIGVKGLYSGSVRTPFTGAVPVVVSSPGSGKTTGGETGTRDGGGNIFHWAGRHEFAVPHVLT